VRTLAILPIKSLGAAKQRLAQLLGSDPRQDLTEAMFTDVIAALSEVEDIDEIAVVTRDPVARAVSKEAGARSLFDAAEGGQSAAARIGVRYALATGFGRALLVPGDTPLLDPDELRDMLVRSGEARAEVVIVPDRHGTGTNALLLAPPAAIQPSFGPGSFERHLAATRDCGVSHRVDPVASLTLDVDTPEDLDALAGRLDEPSAAAPRTRAALAALGLGAAAPQAARVRV
jgi:2-phospho-L-lactate guanylyltransferase